MVGPSKLDFNGSHQEAASFGETLHSRSSAKNITDAQPMTAHPFSALLEGCRGTARNGAALGAWGGRL